MTPDALSRLVAQIRERKYRIWEDQNQIGQPLADLLFEAERGKQREVADTLRRLEALEAIR